MSRDDCLYMIFNQSDKQSVNMLCTALYTFRKVNKSATIILVYQKLDEVAKKWIRKNIGDLYFWRTFDWDGRGMLCKIENLLKVLTETTVGRVVMSDVDLVFLQDPFEAFSLESFDIGITERKVHYRFPVNGGILFINSNMRTRVFIGCWLKQINNPTWEVLKGSCFRKWPEWFCDQDIECAMYKNPLFFSEKYGISVKVFDYTWNCFVDVDVSKTWEKDMQEIYELHKVKVLHFKADDLKRLYLESWMKDYQEVM